MNTTAIVLPLIKELIKVKRGDVRQSQLDLITSLINNSKEKKDLLNKISVELVSSTNTGQKYVRHNCLTLLTLVFNGFVPILEPDVVIIFESRMRQLIFDRTLRIKLSAIKLVCLYIRSHYATKREIKKELLDDILHLASCDYSSLIRAHIIGNVPFLNENTFEKLLERTKDVDKQVRCYSWKKLADLYFWKYTSSSYLLTCFLRGLKDKDGSVVSTVEQVINDWFSRIAEGSILKAIRQFNLAKEEENVRQLLLVLFRCQNYSLENDYYTTDNLSEANTFLWLSYLEYMKQYKSVEEWEEAIERYLPTIHQFCKVLDKNRLNERVIQKLLCIAHYFDFSDEAGRRKLLKCLKTLLALPYSKKIISNMIVLVRHLFIDDEDESIHFIAAAITLNVRLWPEERQLLFLSVILKHFTATKQMFETHRQLMTKGLTSQHANLRYLAFKCWALCCVSIEPLAEQSSTKLFLLALEKEKDEKVQRIIFQALFDYILLFELTTSDQIFKALCEHFVSKAVNSYSVKTRKLLTLGFCKCYASGRYCDSLVLGQLILKCSSDLFEPEKSIRDLIWRFFDCFTHDEISSIFDDAFKRVIMTLVLSNTTIEPLLIFYKRLVRDSMRLQQISTFLIQQLAKFSSVSLTKNVLDHIEDWITRVSNSIKDEIIFNSTKVLDKIQNDQIKQKVTEFIASLCSGATTTNKEKRKRKLTNEQFDQWGQLSLSIVSSSGLPNKKPKIQSS